MFENAFEREKNGENSVVEPSKPLEQDDSSGGGYDKNTVKPRETSEKTPREVPKVLSGDGTKSLLEALAKPRQNRREEPQETTQETIYDDEDLIDPELVEAETVEEETSESAKSTISDAGISTFVSMGVTYLDIYMPKFLAWLNEVEKSDEYKADPVHIAEIKKHAVVVANQYRDYLIELTPTQQLLVAVGAAYGPGLVTGAFKKSPLLFKFLAGGLKKTAEPSPNQGTKPKPKTNEDSYEPCLLDGCDVMIGTNEGVPKTSKNHPELVERFCCLGHQRSYYNHKGLTGSKSN